MNRRNFLKFIPAIATFPVIASAVVKQRATDEQMLKDHPVFYLHKDGTIRGFPDKSHGYRYAYRYRAVSENEEII